MSYGKILLFLLLVLCVSVAFRFQVWISLLIVGFIGIALFMFIITNNPEILDEVRNGAGIKKKETNRQAIERIKKMKIYRDPPKKYPGFIKGRSKGFVLQWCRRQKDKFL